MVTDWESDSVVGVDTLVDTFDSVVKTFSTFKQSRRGGGARLAGPRGGYVTARRARDDSARLEALKQRGFVLSGLGRIRVRTKLSR